MYELIKLNIQKLMNKKDWNQQILADKSGLSRQTIHSMLDTSSNDYNPKFSTIYSVARALEIDIPTLFSRFETLEDFVEEDLTKNEYINILAGNLSKFANGKTQKQLSIDPGLGESVISKLLSNKDYDPKLSTIQAISNVTGISIEKLFVRGE